MYLEVLQRVKDHVLGIFEQWPSTVGKRLMTDKEAINGIPGNEFAAAIDLDTSPGFPYNLDKQGKRGKRAYIDGEPGDYQIVDQGLRHHVEQREASAKLGMRYPSTWIDTLKD